ncbi:MAG: twin transmembrane helix small protein [Hyphomicrobiales bacterium]|nr:twin transmembrane helix small protein [Hyphomicrobiales bacterium]MDE2113439.1 twin transmembrane helix small protein [Hyphomicrobiales bacterium]
MGNTIVGIAVAAVVLVLIAGLYNMLIAGSPSRSQNLMRWRVGLQFLTVIIIMIVFYFRQ